MSVKPAPLVEAVGALRSGEIDPATYVERCLERVEAVEAEVRALVDEPDRRERLLAEVAELEVRFPDAGSWPPLFGVPVGVKDIFHVGGLPTRAGSEFSPAELVGPEATAVSRLREAGALVAGKTVTTEFAYFEPGPTRNPHDLEHTPGGSSSGSAAAVAAGMCPLALGSQTAGSTIRPAAFCGIVGFKPTYGRIPTNGVIPLAPSLDTVGLFTQDVAGARLAASVLCDDWDDSTHRDDSAAREDPTSPHERPTLGVPAEAYLDRASTVGRDRFRDHRRELEEAGFDVVGASALPSIDEVEERNEALMAAETALSHHERFSAHRDRYARVTADLIEDGREVSVGTLADARAGQMQLRERIELEMAERGVDVWISPAAPGPAPAGIDGTGDPAMNGPWTYAGLPAMTLPAGEVDGLPLGLQCVAAHGADEHLISWAESIAGALDDQS